MSLVPPELRYTESHEYVKVTDDPGVFRVGITDYAQEQLGELVYIEVKTVGKHVDVGDVVGGVEASKAASDLYSPLAGEVLSFNQALDPSPDLANKDPYNEGWIFEIRADSPGDVEGLLQAEAYEKWLETQPH